MNKKNFFKSATYICLIILLILFPNFINQVPVSPQGPIYLLVHFLIKNWGLNACSVDTIYQYVNATFIAMTIFTATRFLKTILGWRAALLGVILLSLFPRFLGASVQNLIDIPFTFFYFLSITQIYSIGIELPRFKTNRLILTFLSSVITALIHPAGSLLIFFLLLFLILSTILKFNVKWHKVLDRRKTVLKIASFLGLISITIFLSGYLSAHYWYKIPYTNPFQSLSLFNFGHLPFKEIFDSKLIINDHLPSLYVVKYLFITTPIVVLIGFFFFLIFLNKMRKNINVFSLLLLLTAFIYPLIFSIIVPMNGKMAWSLYFMTVPFIVVLSIIGFESLLRAIDDRYVNVVISIVLFLLFLSPLRHVIVTAPATSIYFNEFAGGVTSSYTKYSLDLNTHIPKIASKWLINHIYDYDIRDFKDHDTVLVLTDARIDCKNYFAETPFIQVKQGTYKQFLQGEGVYFISFPDALDPVLLKTKQWPPKEAVYSIYIEDAPVVSFIKSPMK